MATCPACGKSGLGFLEVKDGMCPSCRREKERREASMTDLERAKEEDAKKRVKETSKRLLLTTESWIGDVERLGIVASEVVFGMNVFKDILANVRDVLGGRSGAVQSTLDEARQVAFQEIRVKAAELGADAVIAVDIDYHSISTGSAANMMMVAVSGTAVKRSVHPSG